MPKKRDYKKEYREYHSKPEQIKKREMRNKARYDVAHHIGEAISGISPSEIKGKDIDHKHALRHGGSNSPSNWRVRSVHENRGDNKK